MEFKNGIQVRINVLRGISMTNIHKPERNRDCVDEVPIEQVLQWRIIVLTGSTTSQLRDDIDHGRTGDKVDAPDPAAAPLGTDDEAAGTPPDAYAIEAARTLELSRSGDSVARAERGPEWLLIAFVLALGAGLLGWALWLDG